MYHDNDDEKLHSPRNPVMTFGFNNSNNNSLINSNKPIPYSHKHLSIESNGSTQSDHNLNNINNNGVNLFGTSYKQTNSPAKYNGKHVSIESNESQHLRINLNMYEASYSNNDVLPDAYEPCLNDDDSKSQYNNIPPSSVPNQSTTFHNIHRPIPLLKKGNSIDCVFNKNNNNNSNVYNNNNFNSNNNNNYYYYGNKNSTSYRPVPKTIARKSKSEPSPKLINYNQRHTFNQFFQNPGFSQWQHVITPGSHSALSTPRSMWNDNRSESSLGWNNNNCNVYDNTSINGDDNISINGDSNNNNNNSNITYNINYNNSNSFLDEQIIDDSKIISNLNNNNNSGSNISNNLLPTPYNFTGLNGNILNDNNASNNSNNNSNNNDINYNNTSYTLCQDMPGLGNKSRISVDKNNCNDNNKNDNNTNYFSQIKYYKSINIGVGFGTLFLDVDGVIVKTTEQPSLLNGKKHVIFRMEIENYLKKIYNETKCHIIIHSSWQFDKIFLPKLYQLLYRCGWKKNQLRLLKDIIVMNKKMYEHPPGVRTRAKYIYKAIKKENLTKYVIIDDLPLNCNDKIIVPKIVELKNILDFITDAIHKELKYHPKLLKQQLRIYVQQSLQAYMNRNPSFIWGKEALQFGFNLTNAEKTKQIDQATIWLLNMLPNMNELIASLFKNISIKKLRKDISFIFVKYYELKTYFKKPSDRGLPCPMINNHFINTNPTIGITMQHVNIIIKQLQ